MRVGETGPRVFVARTGIDWLRSAAQWWPCAIGRMLTTGFLLDSQYWPPAIGWLANFGPNSANFDQTWPIWAKSRPNSNTHGQILPKSSNLGQCLSDAGQNRPTVGQHWPMMVEFGSKWVNFGQHRPMMFDFGPDLCNQSNSSTSVRQVLRNCSAIVGQLRSWPDRQGQPSGN